MTADNPTLADFGIDEKALMVELQRETIGKLIVAEKEIERLTRTLQQICHEHGSATQAYKLACAALMLTNQQLKDKSDAP